MALSSLGPAPASASGSTAAPSAAAPAPVATETVTRPEPGLARGAWEAPVWVFWVFLALVVLGAAAYVLRRAGLLRLGARDTRSKGP